MPQKGVLVGGDGCMDGWMEEQRERKGKKQIKNIYDDWE